MISLQVVGSNRVRNSLRKLVTITKDVRKSGDKWAKSVRQRLRRLYSEVPGRGGYRRRGKLANSWSVDTPKPATWIFANSQPYSKHVMGPKQASWHKNRWPTLEDIIKEKAPNLTKELTREIEDEWPEN